MRVPSASGQTESVSTESIAVADQLADRQVWTMSETRPVLDAVDAVGRYVEANKDNFAELDINPLAVGQHTAVAVDALIRLRT